MQQHEVSETAIKAALIKVVMRSNMTQKLRIKLRLAIKKKADHGFSVGYRFGSCQIAA
jgi:hypothetical protein